MPEQALVEQTETMLMPAQTPEEAVEYGKRCSKLLMNIVKECNLAKNFGGKKDHLEYEAWSTIAKFYGCTLGSEEAVPIGELDGNSKYIGYKARGYIRRITDGMILSTAEASCMRDEPNWKNKPNFQLGSMAQTRAASKAARMSLSWVAVLAGYSPTPAEEMAGTEYNGKPASQGSSGSSKPITDAQRKKLWALMKNNEMSDTEAKQFYQDTLGEHPTLKQASEFIEKFDILFQEWATKQGADTEPPSE